MVCYNIVTVMKTAKTPLFAAIDSLEKSSDELEIKTVY